MNPKLPLDGHIYTLTVGSVLTTNVSQINLCQLLFKATLKVRLDSCLSLLLEWTTLTATKWMACLREKLIHKWKQALLAPLLTLISLNNSRLCSTHNHSSASLMDCSVKDRLHILVKAQPSTWSTGPRSPTGLGIRSQDLGLPDEYSVGHCGLSATSRHKLAFTRRYYTLLTATDTTALY